MIRTSRADGVTTITIDHPPANALDPDLLDAALDILNELTATPPAAVVITGTGRFFSAGADLRVVPELDADEQAEMVRGVNRLFSGWYHFPRPVIAAVNGHAVAGGLVLALCSDHTVVAKSGQHGLTEVKAGIPFPAAAMMVVHRQLPAPLTRRLMLRGELLSSSDAVRLGLYDELVDDADVLDRACAIAAEMAELPRSTFEQIKQRLRSDDPARAGVAGGARTAEVATSEARAAARTVLDRSRRSE